MKPTVCANCGANDFIEQEDMYICKYCDTFYPKRAAAESIESHLVEYQPHAGETSETPQVHFGEVVDPNQPQTHTGREKNKWITFVLCLLLGGYGVHKFYEGKILMGLIYLFTGGLFYIGVIVDLILILLKPNPYYV